MQSLQKSVWFIVSTKQILLPPPWNGTVTTSFFQYLTKLSWHLCIQKDWSLLFLWMMKSSLQELWISSSQEVVDFCCQLSSWLRLGWNSPEKGCVFLLIALWTRGCMGNVLCIRCGSSVPSLRENNGYISLAPVTGSSLTLYLWDVLASNSWDLRALGSKSINYFFTVITAHIYLALTCATNCSKCLMCILILTRSLKGRA